MESFEDFEFKPLTDGLGFHKKTNNSANSESKIQTQNNSRDTLRSSPEVTKASDLPKMVDFDLPEVKPSFGSLDREILEKKVNELPIETPQSAQNLFSQKPLPREGEIKTPKQTLQVPKFQGPRFTKSITEKPILESTHLSFLEERKEETRAPISNRIDSEIRYKYTEEAPSLLSIFLDSTVIAGLSILFAMSLVVATGVDVVRVMSSSMDLGTQIGIVLLVYSVSQLYYILSRVFFGQTLGEWSLEHQVGLGSEQQEISYVFKLILRSLILTVTGFIVLPIASQITNTDLAGRWSNLKMYRQDQV